jgi:small subunit ribosomal protein S9
MTATTENRYIETVGRRKTSVARVRLTPAIATTITVNDRAFEQYFPVAQMRSDVMAVFTDIVGKFAITAKLTGGGVSSQAQALRHGLARALEKDDAQLRGQLKAKGYLKRDPRAKERRKFGLKKARKAPKWSKR